jgi:ribonuclease HI
MINNGQRGGVRVIVRRMAWIRMRFKGEFVWVHADDNGKPITDGNGRAEMKYRETDDKSYRPFAGNLLPDDGTSGPPPAARPKATVARVASKPRATNGAAPTASAGGAVALWTDGACSGNPGPMGIGVVAIDGPKRRELSEYLGVGTNNIAELTAIERALDAADDATGNDRARHMRVYTDSAYSIGVLSKGWKAKANQALIARIKRRLEAYPNIEFVKVSGHAGVPENERCDELARAAVDRRA